MQGGGLQSKHACHKALVKHNRKTSAKRRGRPYAWYDWGATLTGNDVCGKSGRDFWNINGKVSMRYSIPNQLQASYQSRQALFKDYYASKIRKVSSPKWLFRKIVQLGAGITVSSEVEVSVQLGQTPCFPMDHIRYSDDEWLSKLSTDATSKWTCRREREHHGSSSRKWRLRCRKRGKRGLPVDDSNRCRQHVLQPFLLRDPW